MKQNNLVHVVQQYGVEMISELSGAMKAKGSQNLYDKLDGKVIEDVNAILLEIRGPNSIYYFSEGRSIGKMPPLKNIQDWCKNRNIDIAAAYPIARKLATIGNKQKASHFLNAWKITPEFKDEVMQAYIEDIKEALTEKVNEFNNEK